MADVESFAVNMDEAPKTVLTGEPGDVMTLTPEQQQRVEELLKSVTTIPQVHVSMEINASTMFAAINQWAADNRPSFTALLLQGVGKVLQTYPLFNAAFLSREQIKLYPHVHIAVAVDTPQGLKLPVILNANRQTILEIDKELERLTKKAQNGELNAHDTEGGTFALFNLGMFGISEFSATIHPSRLAVLASGAIAYRLVMTGNRIVNLPFFTVRLIADQRVIDAAMAAKFLRKLKETLEE